MTAIFPSLSPAFPIKRTPMWRNSVQESISGKETRIAYWSSPRFQWELSYDMLRQGSINGTVYTEFQQLFGFFNQLQGMFSPFLYTDVDDNAITDQMLGTSDGTTTAFQLVRTYGGATLPILAPNIVTAVKDNGSVVPGANYAVGAYGTASQGVVTFATAPLAGHTISASFSYYFPCRFADDQMTFEKFVQTMYDNQSVKFVSLKN